MNDVNIFEHAISNVNFVESEDGLLLFIYATFEVNSDDVRFYLDVENEKKSLLIHYPSDNIITIEIKSDEIYQKLNSENLLRIFEIDTVDGEMVSYYNAIK